MEIILLVVFFNNILISKVWGGGGGILFVCLFDFVFIMYKYILNIRGLYLWGFDSWDILRLY